MLKDRLAIMRSPLWLVATAAGSLVVGIGLRDHDTFVIFFGLALLALCAIGVFSHEIRQSPRPIVRVWTHNGMTRVIPEVDYQLWRQMARRRELVESGVRIPPAPKPDPEVIILFSDRTDVINIPRLTGTMADCKDLLVGCEVDKSEMWIGLWAFGYHYVATLPEAYRLVHGPDAKPPAPTEASEPPTQIT